MGGIDAQHDALVADLTRRGLLQRGGVLGLAALVAYAGPVARALVAPEPAFAEPDLADGTLQAFADTMIPGRKAPTAPSWATRSTRRRSPASIRCPARCETDALALYHHPQIGFDALEPAFLADLSVRVARRRAATSCRSTSTARVAVCLAGLSFDNPSRVAVGGRGRGPVHRLLRRRDRRPTRPRRRPRATAVMGLPGAAPNGYAHFSYRQQARPRSGRSGGPCA